MKSVLIVDDNLVSLKQMGYLLEGKFEVFQAKSGHLALTICEEKKPDIILLDVKMPVMDGLQFIANLKNTPNLNRIPVIFMTSDDDPITEVNCLRAGAIDFVKKPVNANILYHRLQLHLDFIEYQSKLELESLRLSQALSAKTAFFAMISHEIRTPMNAILGITESQLQKVNLEPEYKGALDKIHSAGNTLLEIINDVLDISKIDAIKIDLNPEKYEVASLIYNVANMNSVRYGDKPIDFKLNISEHIPRTLVGDQLRIKQVLNNVLSNAFKYTNEGEIEFSLHPSYTELSNTNASGMGKRDCKFHLVLVVSDTGVGMTKEEAENIFDEYSRFNLRANRTTQGTGLGMYIAHKLVTLMGGEIHVASEVGKGTTITIHLSQGDIGALPLGKKTTERLKRFRENNLSDSRIVFTHTPMPYGTVLVVDDDEMNLFVANALLSPYGLSIETTNSGFAAIEKIKSGKKYDIVFMDYMMPEMDGIEATKIIRSLGYSLPIIVLTADAVTGRAEMFLESGFDEFISKPIDMRQMDIVLKRFIRDKQPCANVLCRPACNYAINGQCVYRNGGP